jgi:hypothetical protein
MIRKFQRKTENEITSVLCGKVGEDNFTGCEEILQSLMQSLAVKMNSIGPSACFRLRGDTIIYLFGEFVTEESDKNPGLMEHSHFVHL